MNYAIRLQAVGCLLVLTPLITVAPGRLDAAEAKAETLAATVLHSAEVRGGLCALIGCDNAELAAAGIEKPQPIGAAERWIKIVKPWPEESDQWTHWLHGADGNAVARDSVVAPPRHLQ